MVAALLNKQLLLNRGTFISALLFYAASNLIWAITFTPQEAVQYALKQSPQLSQFAKSKQIEQLQVNNARAKLLPSLDITSDHNVGSLPNEPTTTTSGFALKATETLYNNGQNILGYQKSKLEQATAGVDYQRARDQFIRDIMINIIELSLQKRLYKIQESNLQLLEQQYQQAQQEYKNGLRTQEDVIRFRNNVRSAQIALITAKETISQTRNNLLAKMGIQLSRQSNPIRFSLFKVPNAILKTQQSSLPLINKQYEYQLKMLQQKINKVNLRADELNYWPNANLTASAGYGNTLQNGFFSAVGSNKDFDWSLMLTLSYNLWDWGTRANNIAITRYKNETAINKIDETLNTRASQIKNTLINLKNQQHLYKISTELLSSEQSNYQRIQQNYREGKLTFLDVINAITSLSQAEAQVMNAQYNVAKAYYRYQFDQGKIYEAVFS